MSRYIDADKLILSMRECAGYEHNKHTTTTWSDACEAFIDEIEDMLVDNKEDVAPVKHSHWVEKIGIKPKQGIKYPVVGCLNCGTVVCDLINVHGVIYHYCPHCGAKMNEK